ncbi:MAG: bifunctional pyr operon transcriptional regulator/uracil phosphoribosyltransferase PyrR [Oscillospiraceae bacterium]|nr:bifunctional pyr operon transcriptional regulator/uracil phosphoribosyltransferase PyrR [Oscillospiraceae bacterium]
MEFKSDLMDSDAVKRCLIRISHQILERNGGTENLCLVGIKTRGVPIAEIIRENIFAIEGKEVPVGTIDISFYRDDIDHSTRDPKITGADFPFDVTGKTIVLVDDVVHTGRTTRAAMDCLLKHGRPAYIQLAAVIDRGHRELPIRPDFVGKNIPTSREELISVRVPSIDGEFGVKLFTK